MACGGGGHLSSSAIVHATILSLVSPFFFFFRGSSGCRLFFEAASCLFIVSVGFLHPPRTVNISQGELSSCAYGVQCHSSFHIIDTHSSLLQIPKEIGRVIPPNFMGINNFDAF